MAAMKDGSIQKGTKELDQMFDNLVAQCNKKSLLDRINEKRRAFRSVNTPVESQAVMFAGTDGCPGTAIPAGTSFADTGTTIGSNNTVTSVQSGCSNYTTVAGPDQVYRFTLPALGSRIATCSIVVTPTGGTGYDPAIYTLSATGVGCPAGTGTAATNCVNGADAGLGDGAETITDAEMDAMPAGNYYLFIDSFYSTPSTGGVPRQNGPYSLQFTCTTLTPTAAGVGVSGRVLTSAEGRGLVGAVVRLTDQAGVVRTTTTTKGGTYTFDDLEPGQTYIVSVSSRRFNFQPQVIQVTDNIAELNFVPE
ncbi:MAG TPA: carboxypeptidase regulatory-like domain-containing protein [Pyrinomonadaceae bacterium]|nr:carboxypeptidase regulatory-like domain-containing protein [Pyrinomonadaceae bacterium]